MERKSCFHIVMLFQCELFSVRAFITFRLVLDLNFEDYLSSPDDNRTISLATLISISVSLLTTTQ